MRKALKSPQMPSYGRPLHVGRIVPQQAKLLLRLTTYRCPHRRGQHTSPAHLNPLIELSGHHMVQNREAVASGCMASAANQNTGEAQKDAAASGDKKSTQAGWLHAGLTLMRVSHASPVQPAGQRHQPARWSHTPAGSSAGWTAASGQRWWQRSRQKSASDGRAPRTTLTHKIAAPQAGSVCCGRRLGRDGHLHQVVSAPSARGPPASLLYVLRSGRRCCHFKLYCRCRHWRRCRCLRLGDCRRRCQRRCAAGSSRPIHGACTLQRLPDRLRHLQKWPGCYLRRRGGNRSWQQTKRFVKPTSTCSSTTVACLLSAVMYPYFQLTTAARERARASRGRVAARSGERASR